MAKKLRINRQALIKAVEPQMREIAGELTRDYERMRRELRGKPLGDIKAKLVRYHQDRGGEISEPELMEHAEQLQEGERVVFTFKGTVA